MNNDFYNVLIIDDNPAIHEDFVKIFNSEPSESEHSLKNSERLLFGNEQKLDVENKLSFTNIKIDSAYQGKEGIDKVKEQLAKNIKYAIAFVDIRMPPGIDGIETISELWKIDPDLQVVICSAYSDYTWQDIADKLGESEQLLILKKPFDIIEVKQIVTAFIKRWDMTNEIAKKIHNMRAAIENKNEELENFLLLIKTTLELTTDGIIIFNKDGLLIDFNRNFTTYWDIQEDYLKYVNFSNIATHLLSKLKNADQVKELFDISKIGLENEFSARFYLHNGTVLDCYSKPQYMKNQIVARVWCFNNVTEFIKMQETLIQSEKMAVVGLLATGTAHELNQPLSIIRTNLQTLELLYNNSLSEEDLSAIITSTTKQINRTSAVIDKMRSLAKNESPKQKQVDIAKIIEAELDLFYEEAQLKNIKIIRNFDPAIPQLYMSEHKAEKIIQNLLSNAKDAIEVKYKKVGDEYNKQIVINLHYNADNKTICLAVNDNGVGMTEEVLNHCFDPFYTTKEVGDGSGLGLSIIYNIVKSLHGTIDVQSNLNQGTKVCIELPINTL